MEYIINVKFSNYDLGDYSFTVHVEELAELVERLSALASHGLGDEAIISYDTGAEICTIERRAGILSGNWRKKRGCTNLQVTRL